MNELTDKQNELARLMSDISERCWCAGWLVNNEYELWRAIQTGCLRYGMGTIRQYEAEAMRQLAMEIGGWIVYKDGIGETYVNMLNWIPMWNKYMEKWLRSV